jgi:hypothetical protein
MTNFNALMLSLVFGILFFTILNANHSFVQLFQPGAQDEFLLSHTHPNNKKEVSSPNTVVAQNEACTNATSNISC